MMRILQAAAFCAAAMIAMECVARSAAATKYYAAGNATSFLQLEMSQDLSAAKLVVIYFVLGNRNLQRITYTLSARGKKAFFLQAVCEARYA